MIVFECDVCGSKFKSEKDAQPNNIIVESCTYEGNARSFKIPSIRPKETFGLRRDLCPRCMNAILQVLYPKNEESTKSCKDCIHAPVCLSYSYASKDFNIANSEKMANDCNNYIHNYNIIKGE